MPSKDEMVTPSQLDIAQGTVIPPAGGWKPHTVYVVLAAFSEHNIIHGSLFYTGFSTGGKPYEKLPGGYNAFLDADPDTRYSYRHAYFMKALRPLYTKRGNYLAVDSKDLEGVGNYDRG